MANIFYYLQEKYFKRNIFPFFLRDHAGNIYYKTKDKPHRGDQKQNIGRKLGINENNNSF